jgi:hypothetical protein
VLDTKTDRILNKSLDFWNLVDTYNHDVIIGTESWLREEISNAVVFRDDYTTFGRSMNTRGGGVLHLCKRLQLLARNYGWTRISR